MSQNRTPRPPLQVLGIIFSFSLNLLLVSVVYIMATSWRLEPSLILAFIISVAVVAGLATTLYVGPRSGIHSFIGGMLSAPVLALFVFPAGNLPYAILAGSFCAVGGIAGEFFIRRRAR
jgi:hypothetical protein